MRKLKAMLRTLGIMGITAGMFLMTGCGGSNQTAAETVTTGAKQETTTEMATVASEVSNASEAADGTTTAARTPKDGKQFKVGIIQMIENGAFNDMREGFVDELRAQGYAEDQLLIEYKCAQGDATNLQTIAQGMSDGSYDLVATIATPPTQAMVNIGTDTPVIFVSVSAPVKAGVITDMDHPDKNATGTSNAIPMDQIFGLAEKLTPDAKSFGILYCTSEVNSVNTAAEAKAYCEANGMTVTEKTVTNSSEVQQAAQALAGSVDAIFIPNDSVVQSAMTLVSEVARDAKIPVYCSSATTVESGAFATVAISDKGIGKISADKALDYLNGTDIADIPAEVVPADETVINKTTMEALGLTVQEDSSIRFVEDAL